MTHTKDEALKLALEDLLEEYDMVNSSFAKRMDDIFKQALAAPVQEPDHGDELTIAYMSGVHKGKKLASQRQWVALSDLNIDKLENEYMKSAQTAHQFLRAIEAKLKELNT